MSRAIYLMIILLAAVVLASSRPGAAAPLPDRQEPVQEPSFRTSPVVIDGTVLFPVRGLRAFPAAERASTIGELIEKTARDHAIRTDAVATVETDISTDIVADGTVIMSVFDSDARPEGVKRQVLAKVYAGKVREAVARYRQDRNPR